MKTESELWVIKAQQPVPWSVPFLVKWITGDIAITYWAKELPGWRAREVAKFLDTIAKRVGETWEITRTALELHGKQADPMVGVNRLFSWGEQPKVEPPKPPQPAKQRSERELFLDRLYKKGVGVQRVTLDWWWQTFCQHMLDELINQEAPIDLYFAKLHISPYRANWRTTMLSRHPRLGWGMFGVNSARRHAFLINSGALEDLVSPDMLAYSSANGYCYRGIDVELTPTWFKRTRTAELTRRLRLGANGYAKSFMDRIRQRLGITVRLYSQWLGLIARPSAVDVESGDGGEFRFAPNATLRRDRPPKPRTFFVPPVVPNKPPLCTPASLPEDLQGTYGDMPPVHPVQPKAPDVRNGRPHLFQRRREPFHAPWLPLLPAGEKCFPR